MCAATVYPTQLTMVALSPFRLSTMSWQRCILHYSGLLPTDRVALCLLQVLCGLHLPRAQCLLHYRVVRRDRQRHLTQDGNGRRYLVRDRIYFKVSVSFCLREVSLTAM